MTAPPTAPPQTPPVKVSLSARALSRVWGIRREDFWLAASYFIVFWILDAVRFGTATDFSLPWLARNWVLFAVLGCVGVLLRRTATPAMAVLCGVAAVLLLLANQPAALVLVFELFFSLVLFGSTRASTAAGNTAVGLSILLTLVVFAFTRQAELTVVAAVLAAMTLLMPVEWAGNLRKAQRLAESESARAEAVRQAAEHRLLADRTAHELVLERERQHMARELHDVLSARLSAIALQSGAALQTPPLDTPSPQSRVLTRIRAESVAGLDELNGMIRLLHTGALDETAGRVADLASLVEQYRLAGTAVSLENSLDDAGNHLPLHVQTAIYRVSAESLLNASRHAPGSPVTVVLDSVTTSAPGAAAEKAAGTAPPGDEALAPAAVRLRVSNQLPGLPQDRSGQNPPAQTVPAQPTPAPATRGGTGTGIPSMHFRAAHAGGSITAGPRGSQWVVELRLPAPAPAASGPASAQSPAPAPQIIPSGIKT
ncbi:MAG: sensor histidine kinase [Specibacter sp.]